MMSLSSSVDFHMSYPRSACVRTSCGPHPQQQLAPVCVPGLVTSTRPALRAAVNVNGKIVQMQGAKVSETPWALEGRSLASTGPRVAAPRSVGLVGDYAGRTVHIVDVYALCDPLLSGLPSTDAWPIGHFERRLPERYLETLSTGQMAIRDPRLAALYQKIVTVTRAPLLSRARLNAVIDLNGGGSDQLIVAWKSAARTPDPRQLFGSVR